jgi:hypothetical protein
MPKSFDPSIMPPARLEKEKKEFLEREEIRTMQKDITRLRELEARGERKRIATLKTGEEERKKTARLKKLERKAIERRETAEREAERREETHKMAKEERKRLEMEEKGEEKTKLEGVKRSMEETQEREEEERRKFLERVQLKGEGRGPEIKAGTDRLREEKERKEREEILRREREEKEKELRGSRDRFRQREELEPLEKPEAKAEESEKREAPKRFEKPREEFRPPQPPEEAPAAKGKAKSTFIPRVVFKKPSLFDKVLIRVIIIILLVSVFVNLFLFWYWYLKVRETPAVTPSLPSSEETVLPEEEEEEGAPQLTIPSSLIITSSTETIEVINQEEIPQFLAQFMEKDFNANSLTRVLIEDTGRNKVLGLKEFFAAFEVATPGDFLEGLDNDFTLFVYSNAKGENRLGFVVEIKESGLAELLSSWEPTIEKDTETFYEALGKKGTAPIPYFRSAVHNNKTFRYLSFNLPNFGICYSIVDNLLVWTSSGESIMRVIDQL